MTTVSVVLLCWLHDGLSPIPAFRWAQFASLDCRWCLSSPVSVRHCWAGKPDSSIQMTTMSVVLLCWLHDDLSPIPAFRWAQFATMDCRWCLSSPVNVRHCWVWKFWSAFTRPPCACCAFAYGPNMAAALQVFRAEYHLLRSDWLKLPEWLTARNSLYLQGQSSAQFFLSELVTNHDIDPKHTRD